MILQNYLDFILIVCKNKTVSEYTKFLIIFLISTLVVKVEASQIRVLLGPKVESVTKPTQSRSRSNPSALILEFDTKIYENIFLSIGTSGEFDIGTLSSNGFALYGSARYYLKGNPDLKKSTGNDIKLQLVEPLSYFVGLGLFQKSITFNSEADLKDIKEDVGGLVLSAGGNYSLTNRYFLSGYLAYLVSGPGTTLDYSSFELYFGAGLRF